MTEYGTALEPLSGESGLFVGGNQTRSSDLVAEAEMLVGAPSSMPTMTSSGTFVVQGLQVRRHPQGVFRVLRYVGEPNVPGDIKRLRRSSSETMRRMGTPVIIKRMFTDRDANLGVAEKSPNFNDVYGQTRNRDPLSLGTGYVSMLKSENEYINTNGTIYTSELNVPGGTKAPKYRGYGPGYLTYIVEPDVAEDFYKHTPEGVLVRIQTATAQSLWWPDINDNDLIIHVELDSSGDIVDTFERYQAKMVNPVSLRGLDHRGSQEYGGDLGNRYVINQGFQMVLLPRQHVLYDVNVDR